MGARGSDCEILSLRERVGAERRGEGLRSFRKRPNPSSGRFAATFSLREKDGRSP